MDGTGTKIVHSALMRSTPPECTRQTRTARPVVQQRTAIPGQAAHEATRLRSRRTNADLPRPNRPDRLKRPDRPGQPELRERPEESSGPNGPVGSNGRTGRKDRGGRNDPVGLDGRDGANGLDDSNGLDGSDGRDDLEGCDGPEGCDGRKVETAEGWDCRDGAGGSEAALRFADEHGWPVVLKPRLGYASHGRPHPADARGPRRGDLCPRPGRRPRGGVHPQVGLPR